MDFLSTIKSKARGLPEILVVLGGVALLFAASQAEIPLKPVPITLQTVAVMLIGLTYTPRRAVESHLMWIGLGAVGLPVFSGFAGGLPHLAGPTAGYMGGFVIAAFLMATFKKKLPLKNWFSDFLLCVMGTAIVITCGVLWLSQLIGFSSAVTHGIVPFILPGVVKAGLLCTGLQILLIYKQK
ncbi:MAG: biotin transporter BioY [Alphaproteobacteria bacterium]|nr:biotin transporter BioY [Alphaproteobacteria bacterium]